MIAAAAAPRRRGQRRLPPLLPLLALLLGGGAPPTAAATDCREAACGGCRDAARVPPAYAARCEQCVQQAGHPATKAACSELSPGTTLFTSSRAALELYYGCLTSSAPDGGGGEQRAANCWQCYMLQNGHVAASCFACLRAVGSAAGAQCSHCWSLGVATVRAGAKSAACQACVQQADRAGRDASAC